MYRYNNLKMPINHTQDDLLNTMCKKLRINKDEVRYFHINKKAIDARKKEIMYVYNLDFKYSKKVINKNVIEVKKKKYYTPHIQSTKRPIVIGTGPSGLFCALLLCEAGLKPIIFEQGKKVEDRQLDVEKLISFGELNPLSNIQFGEGGAGTFSDGKLTTGVKDIRKKKVVDIFIENGAPEEIAYLSKPHIGTDNLIDVVKNMREKIISYGGEIHFNSQVIDLVIENNEIKGVEVATDDTTYIEKSEHVVLAIGHSSRKMFEVLYNKGVNIESKSFAVGFRIEHTRDFINKSQYGEYADKLPSADYKLATNLSNGRGVYSFCMCPGGVVVPAQSEQNTIVTNGMSNFKRNATNSNSAILTTVKPSDFYELTKDNSPLAGILFQRELERNAYNLNNDNSAPVQLTKDYVNGSTSNNILSVKPSIPRAKISNISEIFTEEINNSLKEGLREMNNKIKGFVENDSIITAVESRSSSPVRIIRDNDYNSNIKGLIPCGEGCGYAGGITSSAIDGIKCAEKLIESMM